MSDQKRRPHPPKLLADILWLSLLTFYVLAGTPLVPFHGDEATLIYMGRDTYDLLQGDFERLLYQAEPVSATDQHLRLLNGVIPKHLFGLAALIGGYEREAINDQYLWGAGWDYNLQNGHLPTADLLLRARWVSAVMLAGAVIALYALSCALGGRVTALVASAYFALNPAVLLNGRRAMMEGGLLLMSVLLVLVGVWLLRRPRVWRYLLLGIVTGLGVAMKHTGALTAMAVFLALASWGAWQAWRSREGALLARRWGGLLVAGLLSLSVFVALNPAWWSDPVSRVREVLTLRTDLLSGQTAYYGSYADALDRLAGLARQTLLVTPQYYEAPAWADFIGDDIARYEASIWRGFSLGGTWPGALAILTLLGLGGWALLRERDLPGGERWLIVVWASVTLTLVLVATPLEWQRYYLPLYPVIAVWLGLGVRWLIRQLQAIKAIKAIREKTPS